MKNFTIIVFNFCERAQKFKNLFITIFQRKAALSFFKNLVFLNSFFGEISNFTFKYTHFFHTHNVYKHTFKLKYPVL